MIGVTNVDPTKILKQYDYGDGSYNLVGRGYESILYYNGEAVNNSTASYYGNSSTNFRLGQNLEAQLAQLIISDSHTTKTSRVNISSGTNTYSVTCDATDEEKLFLLQISGGGLTRNVSIGSLKFVVNGEKYNLSELVSNNIIKPLIILDSDSTSGNYYWSDFFNIYTGGTTSNANFPTGHVIIMINKGNVLTGFEIYSNINFNTTYDGWLSWQLPLEYGRLTLNAY